MSKQLQWVLGISILIISVTIAGVGYCASWALQQWGSAAPNLTATIAKVNQTLDNVNQPCKGQAGPDACGSLAQVNKTVIKVGDAIVTTQLQERIAAPHVTAAMDEFGNAARHLSGTADSLAGTAAALTTTAQGATATLAEGERTVAAARPLLDAYARSGDDLDALLKRKALSDLMDNLADVSAHGNAIAGDFQEVADKAKADYLRPVPWYMQPIKRAGDIMDISAAIARHTP